MFRSHPITFNKAGYVFMLAGLACLLCDIRGADAQSSPLTIALGLVALGFVIVLSK